MYYYATIKSLKISRISAIIGCRLLILGYQKGG
jgi:hypothetical protein